MASEAREDKRANDNAETIKKRFVTFRTESLQSSRSIAKPARSLT